MRFSLNSSTRHRHSFLTNFILLSALLTALVGVQSPGWVSAAPPAEAAARPQFAPTATVTLNVPGSVTLGADFNFTATFDNTDAADTGYGPFIDLVFPLSGIDGYDGIDFVGASYLSTPIADVQENIFGTADTGGCSGGLGPVSHPYAVDSANAPLLVCGNPGDKLVTLLLPFGSFTPAQPAADITVTAILSDFADVPGALSILARGGYQFGETPLNDWCCGDVSIVSHSETSTTWPDYPITPTVLSLTKTYNGPEDETATGPNFPRQYTLAVDIATGQPFSSLTITDALPDNVQFISATPSSGSCPTPPPSTSTPGGTLTCNLGSVTGAAGTDATVTVDFYIPLNDSGGSPVIDAASGDAVISQNSSSVSAFWTPADSDDTPTNVSAGGVCPEGCHNLTDRSIAIQKGVTVVGGGNVIPGAVLEYTLEFQVSDFFAFDDDDPATPLVYEGVLITDVISDGQRLDSTFAPTIAWFGNSSPAQDFAGTFTAGNYTVSCNYSPAPGPECTTDDPAANNGLTTVTYRISAELATQLLDDRLIGGCIDPATGSAAPDCAVYDDGPTMGTITYRTVVQDSYSDNFPSGDPSVDQGDLLSNDVEILGAVLNTGTLAPTGQTETDDSAAGVEIETGSLTKEIFAVNGAAPGSPVEVKPGDVVTYRFTYEMPTGDEENLTFTDYLPLPIFYVADPDANDTDSIAPAGPHNDGPAWSFDPSLSTGVADVPASGEAMFGPDDTFFAYSGLTPALSIDATSNSLSFAYIDFDGATEQTYYADFLFSVTVSTEPFADRLYLTNQVNGSEGSTQNNSIASDAIVQLIITEPVLTSTKAVIWTSNPDDVFMPAALGPSGVTFLAPGSSPRWTGTVNSGPPGGLQASGVDSDVQDVDAGDTITFAITIENSGSSLKGAFDIQISDVLQAQYQIPAGGLNLQVYYGNGTGPIPYQAVDGSCTVNPGADNDPCGLELFDQGLELIDPGGATGVCQAHDPNLGNNIILITYDLEIRTGVAPGTILNTATLLQYAGEEDGPNHVPTPSPYTDTASVTISGAPLKFFVSTSEIHTDDSGVGTSGDPRLAAVGEVIRYRIAARIPESTSTDFQVRDFLPFGLVFFDDGTATIGFVSDGGITSTAIGSVPAIPGACNITDIWGVPPTATVPPISCLLADFNVGSDNSTSTDPDSYGNGDDVYFKLGNLVNSDLDDDGEYAVIEFNALVHNLTSNQNDAGDTRGNFVGAYAGSPLAQVGSNSQTLWARIVEPSLTVDKTHSAIAATVDANDTVTYTVTIANPGGADSATAFDAVFVDVLDTTYLTLNLGSITIMPSAGASGEINGSSGNTVNIYVASIPLGGQVVITYEATTTSNVTPSQAILNTGDVTWTSLPGTNGTGNATPGSSGTGNGERNGAFPIVQPNDHAATDTAQLDVHDPFFSKSLDSSSAGHTFDPALAIGEVATFGLYVTLPEGTTPGLTVVDDLPPGLEYVPNSVTRVEQTNPPALCGTLTADFAGTFTDNTDPEVTAPGGSGGDVTFEFDSVLVTGDNVPSNNTFLICFDAVVLNEAGNQASPPPLTNSATLTVEGQDFSDAEDVNLVEPVLEITKTADDDNPIVGEIVTFTITVDNTNLANGADAFDVVILDNVPPPDFTLDLDPTPGSVVITPSSVDVVGINDASSGNQVRIEIDELPEGESVELEFEAVYNGPTTPISNTASVTWTSLPGSGAGTDEERTGAGGVDDYSDSDQIGLDDVRTVEKDLDTTIDITSNETLPDVTIGDLITYEIVLTIPAGSSDLYTIIDTLDTGLPASDSGLAFVAVESFVLSDEDTDGAGLADTGIYFSGVGSTTPVITNDGAVVTFNLGTVNNTGSTAETITIRYQAAVLDVLINSNGGGVVSATQLSNEVVVTWVTPAGGGDSQSDSAAPVTVNEPLLTMDKTVDPLIASPGATITYTLQVEHLTESTGDAFDLVLTDVLPAGLVYAGGTPTVNTTSGPAPVAAFDAPTRTLTLTWANFPFGSVSVMEIEAQLGPTLGRGSTIVNEASLEWTSLPGDFSAPQSAFNSFSTERRYDPANPADVYIVASTATLTIPALPRTGFAPGEVTLLPPQPENLRYAALGDFWIEIPKLDEQLDIVGVPFDSQGWNLTWLGAQAGYLEGTAYPTHAGNSGITAHAYLPDGTPGPFVNLNRLRYGDRIIVHLGAQLYVFEVRENRRVAPNDLSVLKHEEFPWLTLITCQDYSESLDDYRYRVAVRAVLVKIEAPSGR